uniref:ADP-ribosyl cyclase/cyclic ADP-ribose hydrolase n=1 Tax=Fagus sylvatica TaxID=28930 RepID=A0A2N9II20_FAGSY
MGFTPLVFRDDRKLRRGKDIWTELEKAIETSRIAIIVFSTNYAASRWCLDELAKIMECERRLQQIVLPVFYDVDPSDVRNQKGSLEKAFAMHQERFREGKVARWRAALTKAASLSGWDLQNVAHCFESELIEKIIGDISNKLNPEYFMVASYPVGLETRMQNLSKLLNRDSSDVCMVGIWGIGGIGKTTIAKAIYNQLQRKFKGSCFLEDVREIAKKPDGLIALQELILSSVHVNDNRKIKHVDQGTMVIKERAWCKRVLVVLDDVDHRDQLEKLAIRRGYFQPGSIIIITTRDKSMLKLGEVDEIYMPQELDHHESIKLLSWHAFGKDHPNENYAELSKEVIYYARGLPLVLKVLGSFLSNKSTDEWEVDCSNRLRMHDMIRDMGREVVRTESPKVPGERSRLWFHEDVLDVLKYHTYALAHQGTKKVEGIMLNLLGVHNFRVDSRALAKMDRLKVLQLNFARLKGNFHCPSKMLRYLEWYGFPMESIPADLYMENLVAIYMPYSSLIELWMGTKILPKLKFLDVSHSYHLRRTPDFSRITNLEVLVLNNCTSLVEVHESIAYLDKLVTLDLENCSATNLQMVRNVFKYRATRPSLVKQVKVHKSDAYLYEVLTSNSERSIMYEVTRDSSMTIPSDSLINLNTLHKLYTLEKPIALNISTLNTLFPLRKLSTLNALKLIDLAQWRSFQSIGELPICLQVTLDANANNATSLDWILLISNWNQSQQLIYAGRSELLKKIPTSNLRKKLLKELIALDSFSVFIPGVEFPDWFDYKSTGSILSFVVPPLVKQKIRGWFLCVIFASHFHDIHGFTVISGDEVEYSIQLSGSFQVKKFGINLIYENDKKDYQSHFEAMIQNASLPYQYDFLHEDVSTDQAMAGDKKIHPPYVQNRLFDGNGQPYVHETPQGTMLFEGGAPYEQNLYSSCIPTMTSVSKTRRLRSLEFLWEAERQLLRDQLENEQRAHWATREDAAMASRQLRVQNAAFESENIRLRMALAHTSQFSPQLYMDPPCPHFESESASSSQFATASSSSALGVGSGRAIRVWGSGKISPNPARSHQIRQPRWKKTMRLGELKPWRRFRPQPCVAFVFQPRRRIGPSSYLLCFFLAETWSVGHEERERESEGEGRK